MSISETKFVPKKMATDPKELSVGQRTQSNSGKFSAALNDAQREKQASDTKDKLLKNQELVSAKLTDPSSHPIEKKLDDE